MLFAVSKDEELSLAMRASAYSCGLARRCWVWASGNRKDAVSTGEALTRNPSAAGSPETHGTLIRGKVRNTGPDLLHRKVYSDMMVTLL